MFAEKVPLARVLSRAKYEGEGGKGKGKGKARDLSSSDMDLEVEGASGGVSGGGVKAFDPVRVREISMGRLHTGLITDEQGGGGGGNVRLCGYGTGGR